MLLDLSSHCDNTNVSLTLVMHTAMRGIDQNTQIHVTCFGNVKSLPEETPQ